MTAGEFTVTRDDLTISDAPGRLDFEVIHGFLASSYWAENIPRETVRRALANSLNIGHSDGRGKWL